MCHGMPMGMSTPVAELHFPCAILSWLKGGGVIGYCLLKDPPKDKLIIPILPS